MELKPTTTPWHVHDPKEVGKELNDTDATTFRAMIGSLLWVTLVRPDISHAVSKLSSSMHKPLDIDLAMAVRVFRYLKGTMDDVLTYSMQHGDREAILGVGYLTSPYDAQTIEAWHSRTHGTY